MKKAVTIWALKGGTTGDISVMEAARRVKAAGFDALEASFWKNGELSLEASPAAIRKLQQDLKAEALTISSLSTLLLNDASIIAKDRQERQYAMNVCTRMLEIASDLGVETVSISPGRILEDVSYRECLQRSLEQTADLTEIAKSRGVLLCVENVWQGLLLSPLDFSAYCQSIASPYLAACMDIGNASISTCAQHWITELSQQIKKVHMTDLKKRRNTIYEFVDPSKGDIDWRRVIRALKEAHYQGYVTIEAFAKPQMEDGVRLQQLCTCLDTILAEGEKENG